MSERITGKLVEIRKGRYESSMGMIHTRRWQVVLEFEETITTEIGQTGTEQCGVAARWIAEDTYLQVTPVDGARDGDDTRSAGGGA